MSKFINLINTVIEEQSLDIEEQFPTEVVKDVSNSIDSALPTPETIDLNEEKYKTLLMALKKSLYKATDDLDLKNAISNINIDRDPKKAEEELMNILNQLEMPTSKL
jgi:phosphoribosylformylglycinamidine (FGAM) synthase PurS component